jgi:hypothetical protein
VASLIATSLTMPSAVANENEKCITHMEQEHLSYYILDCQKREFDILSLERALEAEKKAKLNSNNIAVYSGITMVIIGFIVGRSFR